MAPNVSCLVHAKTRPAPLELVPRAVRAGSTGQLDKDSRLALSRGMVPREILGQPFL
jgi:hypothetical protein